MIKQNEKGIILGPVLIFIAVMSIIAGGLILIGRDSLKSTAYWQERDQCFELAQSSLEKTKWDIYERFHNYYFENHQLSYLIRPWFNTHSETSIGVGGNRFVYLYPKDVKLTNEIGGPMTGDCPWKNGTYSVSLAKPVMQEDGSSYDLTITVTAKLGKRTRIVQERVRYGFEASPVFNYAIFTNGNYTMSGGFNIFGNIGLNGNGTFEKNPTLLGFVVACQNKELGLTGTLTGAHGSLTNAEYTRKRPPEARPAASDTVTDPYIYYDKKNSVYERESQPEIEMPPLGNIQGYKSLAKFRKSKLEVWNKDTNAYEVVTTDGTYNGVGPDGIAGTGDDGVLVIDGTIHPIKISGPVVITGDVLIKGSYTGQGTIYSGRNIQLLGNVEAVSPPNWSEAGVDGSTNNGGNDMLALAAKGNLVFGNTTRLPSSGKKGKWKRVKELIADLKGSSYKVQPGDADLGYDTNPDPNVYEFNGDYLAKDGGRKSGLEKVVLSNKNSKLFSLYGSHINGLGQGDQAGLKIGDKIVLYKDGKAVRTETVKAINTGSVEVENSVLGTVTYDECKKLIETSDRRYYEPSVTNEFLESLQTPDRYSITDYKLITKIDAICYSNHLRMGHLGTCQFHGCMVQRKVATTWGGQKNSTIIWDRRVLGTSGDFIGLPRSLAKAPKRIYWREIQ